MKRGGWILIVMIAVLGFSVAFAQADLTEVFVSEDGSLSFNYPTGWIVQEENGSFIGGNSREFIESFFEYFQGESVISDPDQVGFLIFKGSFADLGLSNSTDPAGILSAVGVDTASNNLQQTEINGVALTFGEFDGRFDRRFVGVRLLDADHVGLILGLAHPDSLSTFQQIFLGILASAGYSSPPPPTGIVLDIPVEQLPMPSPGSDGIVWTLNLETGGYFFEKMALDASDNIYLTIPVDDFAEIPEALDGGSGFFGIQQLNADGVIQRSFYNPEVDLEAGSNLAAASDGSFWYIDVDFEGSYLYHLGADGAVLSRQSIYEGYVGEARIFLAVDAENNVYVNLLDEVTVWDAEGSYVGRFEYSGDLVAISPAGTLYFYVDGEPGSIVTTDQEGSALDVSITLPESFTYSTAAAASGDFFYIVSPYGTEPTIYQYDAVGTLVGSYALPDVSDTTTIGSLSVLSGGDLVIAYGSRNIMRVSPTAFGRGN